MHYVFISYLRENKDKVDKLCEKLTSHGIEAWLDRRELDPGDRWKRKIKKAIHDGAFFIACFSKEYHKRDKTYMNEELTLAIEQIRQLHIDRKWFIPVKLDDCEIPDIDIGLSETLQDFHYVNLYKDWNAGIQRIIEVIQSESPEPTGGGNTGSKPSGNSTDQDSENTKSFQSNVSQDRGLTDWVFQQGDDLMGRGEINRALEAYSHGINLDPYRPVAYRNRGAAYHAKNDYDRAAADYSKAIELNPHDADTYYNRGVAYSDINELDLAIQDYTKVIQLEPDFAHAYYNRGVAYSHTGEYDLAIQDYTKAIKRKQDYVQAYSNRGFAYSEKDDFDLAIVDYTKAIELNPHYAAAYNNRGLSYVSTGEYDLAIQDYTTAIELNPKFVGTYYNRGIAYGRKNEVDKSIADYIKTVELDSNYTDAYYNLGNAYAHKE